MVSFWSVNSNGTFQGYRLQEKFYGFFGKSEVGGWEESHLHSKKEGNNEGYNQCRMEGNRS